MRNKFTAIKMLALFGFSACVAATSQAQTTIYGQDFEGTYPWGMTTSALNGTSHTWDSADDLGIENESGGTGDCATANSDYWCDEPWDAQLMTPVLDFSAFNNISMTFDSYFQDYIGSGEAWVDVSIDGGTTWTNVYYETEDVDAAPVTIDLDAYSLAPNVRIRWRYSDDDDGCAWYWYIDNIVITGDPAAACTAPPTAGTAVAASAVVCSGSNATVSLTGTSTGSGITYQWQKSTDNVVWANIGAATGSSTSQTVTDTTWFRSIVTCSGQSDTSTAVMVTTNFTLCYCAPTHNSFGATSCTDDYTSNVTFGTINNNSNCGGTQPYNYSDYTAISTQVVKGNSYPISITTDGDDEGVGVWIDYDHSGTFDASEFVLHGYTGNIPETYTGVVTIPVTALTGATRMRVRNRYDSDVAGTDACSTFSYGEVEEYTIIVLPPPADEAGVLSITRPGIAACALGDQIWVNLQNLGSNALTSATFTVKVNNINIGASAWTGSVAPGATMEIQIPVTYALADGDSISVDVSGPNGQVEDPLFAFNNHTGRRVFAGLSGNKTVYGVGADFADIAAVQTALTLRGVCDTVYFKIAANTYTTQHTLVAYTGAGPGRLAVFESATGNAADVTFARNATGTGDNYVFQFDGADGYMFRNLTIMNQGTDYATSIDIRNGSDDLTFENNIIIGDTVGANVVGDFDRIVIASVQGTDDQRTVIKNNQIIGGTRAIILAGEDGSYEYGHVIEGNTVVNNTAMGALIGNVSAPVIANNTFRSRDNVTDEAYGIIVNVSIDGARFEGNSFEQNRSGSNIYLINAKGGGNPVLVGNNFIYSGDSSTDASAAIYVEDANSSDILIANNSISYRSDNGGSGAITLTDGSGIRVLNNNIGAFGTAPALRVEQSFSLAASDYNNLFGTNLSYYVGQLSTTLAAAQTASSKEAHSVSVNPGFNGTDLHTCVAALNGAGWSLANITDDFDGDARSTTPDIGADEFVGDAANLLAEDNFLKCPAASVTIGNTAENGVTYSWTPSGSTSEITVTNAGTYIVTATSACGTFKDTAVVVNKPLPTAAFTSTTVGLAGIFTNTSTNATSYSWSFGDGNTSTEQNPTHVYASAGTYTVSLTVTNDCGSATFGPLPVNVINAGIEETANNVQVALFPNPTDDRFTVTMSGLGNATTVVSVIDVTGKTVTVKNVPSGTNQITLDASTWTSGMYSVKISNGTYQHVLRLVRK